MPPFKIPFANLDDVNLILKNLDTRKAPGPDLLPPKLIKIVKDIINLPLTDVINHIIKSCIFPENGKIAHVTPVFKTDKKDTPPSRRDDQVSGQPPHEYRHPGDI